MNVPNAPSTAAAPAAHWVEAHRVAVWRYLRMLGAGAAEADDLLQETLLAGCAAPPPAPGLEGPFLRGVARNQWLRTRRFWHRRREREVAAVVDDLWAETAEHDGGEELLDRLRDCLQALQPRARQALDLHYAEGLGWSDVAAHLGMKPNGTKTLAQRARQALRLCIERRPT